MMTMMKKVHLDRKFLKRYAKLSLKMQKRVSERLALFKRDWRNPVLRTHKLQGKWKGYLSINVTGDYRAMFEWKQEGEFAVFHEIGTASGFV